MNRPVQYGGDEYSPDFNPSRQVPPSASTCALVDDVLEIFNSRIPEGPSLGPRPIRLFGGNQPQAVINSLPESYVIVLPCLYTGRANQIAYQLGHELFHVFSNPLVEHPWIELIACATSLAVLRLMHEIFESRRGSYYKEYANYFHEYRVKVLKDAFKDVFGENCHIWNESRIDQEARNWARSFNMGCRDRSQQLVAASILEPFITREKCWSPFRLATVAILKPHDSTDAGLSDDWRETVDFSRWVSACENSPEIPLRCKELVEKLKEIFKA